MAKLIKNWEELAQVPPSDTHYLDISTHGGNGMIVTKKPKSNKHSDKYEYLSTHTFYGKHFQYSTELLQTCGFDDEIDNWDK